MRTRTENYYIEKEKMDEAEAYREAIRRESNVAPQVREHLERVEHTVGLLLGREMPGQRPAWKSD